MTPINFRQAAHVGSLAIGFGVVPQLGVLSAVSAVAVSAFVSLGIELVAEKGHSMTCWAKAFKNATLHRIERTIESNPKQDAAILRRAHSRIMKYEESYRIFCKLNHFISPEQCISYFIEKFAGGTCQGQATVLAVKQLLSKEVIREISKEDVYYYQMLFELENCLHVKIDVIDKTMKVAELKTRKSMLLLGMEIHLQMAKLENPTSMILNHMCTTDVPKGMMEWKSAIISKILQRQPHNDIDEEALYKFLDARKSNKLAKYTGLLQELQKVDPSHPVREITIKASASFEEYTKALDAIPSFGYVRVPNHIFCFSTIAKR